MHCDKTMVADFYATLAVYYGVGADKNVVTDANGAAEGVEHGAGFEHTAGSNDDRAAPSGGVAWEEHDAAAEPGVWRERKSGAGVAQTAKTLGDTVGNSGHSGRTEAVQASSWR